MLTIAIGNRTFQAKPINWSTRTRGQVPANPDVHTIMHPSLRKNQNMENQAAEDTGAAAGAVVTAEKTS